MRVLIAPDSFKECLDAPDVADAIAQGVRNAGAEPVLCPLADGGEGTVHALAAAANAPIKRTTVTGPIGEPVEAVWARLDNASAIIETATTGGLAQIPTDRRNPERTSSCGLGELMRLLADEGVEDILVGLGGSGTVDFGLGVAAALGMTFDPALPYPPPIGDLDLVRTATPGDDLLDLRDRLNVTVLCDVRTRLTGADNAIRRFGPQKGATPEQLTRLESRRDHWIDLLNSAGLLNDWADEDGSGAAGGLGFGLRVLLNARLRPGAPAILDRLGVARLIDIADLVITGEGQIDETSFAGKVVGSVLECAKRAGRPVCVIAGRSALPDPDPRVLTLSDLAGDPGDALADASRWLAEAGRIAVESIRR
ncbi:MAG: glycerate kinase [Phycisphaerales bacterium]